MPFLSECPPSVFFKTPGLSGRVLVFEETFSGTTSNRATTLTDEQTRILDANDYHLFLISASAAGAVNITFRKTPGNFPLRVSVTSDATLLTGSNSDATLLMLSKGQRWDISTDGAVTGLQYGVWVPV